VKVSRIELRLVGLPLVRPFRTSFGTSTRKECVLVRVETGGAEGWGECVADIEPGFSEEFNDGAWTVIREFLGPALLAAGEIGPSDLPTVFAPFRGNPMAKASVIDAVIDAWLRVRGVSLASYVGAARDHVECGVSVGIAPSTQGLLEQVEGYVGQGYRRIKLKIEPGLDLGRIEAVRAAYPDLVLSVDANAAYTLADLDLFRAMDAYGLLMIEQPLHHEDLVLHAELQRAIRTDLCLDESIRSAAHARAALDLGSCRIINIKQGRVGGIDEACAVHDVAVSAGVPVWCGGMLETGVGRALNVALASMPGFTLPGDTSPSSRYFDEDLTEPFEMTRDGTMSVPDGPGIGVVPIPTLLEARTLRTEVLSPI
jgi:O-succinylbenzoate synthase